MLDFKSNPPLSLYIHLPWCIKKCPYCDFNSHAIDKEAYPDENQENAYVDALIKDIESELPRIWGRSIVSIFIGGGTPSLFSAEAIDRLMAALRSRLTFYHNTEVTMEANPGSAEADRFKAYRESGVNRLSIGVQSFDDKKLKALGRVHNCTEALNAIAMAKDAGFDEINIDLMFGLPDQSIDEALSDLEVAIDIQPTHLSWYQLTIEPNTVFYSKPPALPKDDLLWDMQQQGQTYISDRGFNQYEISAYARKGENHQCQHNRNYWQFGDYLDMAKSIFGDRIGVFHVLIGKGLHTIGQLTMLFDDVLTHRRSNVEGEIPRYRL